MYIYIYTSTYMYVYICGHLHICMYICGLSWSSPYTHAYNQTIRAAFTPTFDKNCAK